MGRIMSSTPLVCGHDFVAEVKPRANERVWCWTCFDYKHVQPRQAIEPAPDPSPAPAKPAEPSKPTAAADHEPTTGRCGKGHARTPENVYRSPTTGRVRCRACARARRQASRVSSKS